MASKRKSTQSAPILHSSSPQESIRLLRRQHQKGQDLLSNLPIGEAALDAWENTTREFLIMAFGSDSENVSNLVNIGKYGPVLMSCDKLYWDNRRADNLKHKLEILNSTIEQLEAQLELAPQVVTDKTISAIEAIEQICQRFHVVARQLRARHENRPTLGVDDEYDVQDLLHALLCLFFEDIRPEEWTPSCAGKSSRMDFLLKEERVVVEVKKTRVGLSAKELGSQLIEDIARYKSHPECKVLVCFVYDPEGRISNPRGIERDLSREERNMTVKVIIAPRGY